MILDFIFDVAKDTDTHDIEHIRVKFTNLTEKEKLKITSFIKEKSDTFPETMLTTIFAKLSMTSKDKWFFVGNYSEGDYCYEHLVKVLIVTEDTKMPTIKEIRKYSPYSNKVGLSAEITIDRKIPFMIGQ